MCLNHPLDCAHACPAQALSPTSSMSEPRLHGMAASEVGLSDWWVKLSGWSGLVSQNSAVNSITNVTLDIVSVYVSWLCVVFMVFI